ncbi:MAG: beta-lactamase family protein [Treponema sp.]|jgi:CubicO group peptidase (beta-lactamase class C family)|nr:beta-lactamase family protein [Treponema sp.]
MQAAESGLCQKRLKNVEAYLKRIVDQGKVAGAGGMIIRRGVEAFCASAGYQDMEKKLPMQNDSIYRIFSMSKTFTVAAAMTLYEKALFTMSQPVADFIPAFKDTKVVEPGENGAVRLVPPKRPLNFKHLFTMTSGIPYPSGDSHGGRVMAEIFEEANKAEAEGRPWDTAKMIEESARVPFCFHPGDQWMYGFSHDILGRLIEVISGKTLGVYLKETIFDPLGLKDTAFFIPKEKQGCAAKAYRLENDGLKLAEGFGPVFENDPASFKGPAFESGGGGLCSTMADCALFAQMLLHNGKAGGERILSRKTVELIRANHVPLSILEPSFFPHMAGYGYGLGVRTMLDTAKAGLNGSAGEWAWDGMLGTYYLVDPAEDMTALFFIQLLSGINDRLQRGFVQTVYSAIDD